MNMIKNTPPFCTFQNGIAKYGYQTDAACCESSLFDGNGLAKWWWSRVAE